MHFFWETLAKKLALPLLELAQNLGSTTVNFDYNLVLVLRISVCYEASKT